VPASSFGIAVAVIGGGADTANIALDAEGTGSIVLTEDDGEVDSVMAAPLVAFEHPRRSMNVGHRCLMAIS
jgi:hypothetical protein